MWAFNMTAIAGKHVTNAHFSTTEVHASSCTASQVNLYLAGSISSATTWNGQPNLVQAQGTQNVAYGWSSACPAHSVGFTATAGAQYVAANNIATGTWELRAANEADWHSWKKFSAAASITVTYNSPPGPISGRGVKPCSFQCGAPIVTPSHLPTLSAASTDPDGGNVKYAFQVWASHATSPTTDILNSVWITAPSGHLASWTATSSLGDGDYEYRVKVTDGIDTTAWATWITFTVDSQAPAPPTLTSSAPPGGGYVVGVTPASVKIAPNAADYAWGYAYAISPNGAQITFPSNLTCPTSGTSASTAGYTVICPGSVGAPVSVSIVMPDDTATFAAITFDAAGNTASTPAALSFSASSDPSATKGHSWPTDSDAASCPTAATKPVLDSAASPAALAPGGGVCWTQDAAKSTEVLQFGAPATGPAAATTGAVLNTTQNFTVAAWLNPSQASSTYVATAIAQSGANESVLYLQNSQGHWRLCLASSDAATFAGDCATSSAAVQVNTWTFVVGEYVAADHEILIRTSTTDAVGPPAVASHVSMPASSGAFTVGLDRIGSANRYWSGKILDPVALPSIADDGQLQDLADGITPSNLPILVVGN
jgi:hypothetical protein